MADDTTSPLLGARTGSVRSQRSTRSEESAPLLSYANDTPRYDGVEEGGEGEGIPSLAATSLRSLQSERGSTNLKKNAKPWPTFIAVSILGTIVLVIMAGAFFAPAIVEEYAKQSVIVEPTKLTIDSFTTSGVTARIQANIKLDASRVKSKAVRNIGRAGTWIAREVESKESKVKVYLPEYGNLLLGTAVVPRVVVNIRNGYTNHVDFLAELEPGEVDGIKRIANDWLDGKLGQLRVQGKADVTLKSGIFPLGTQSISESLVFEGQSLYQTFSSFYFGEKTLV
jgi:hypothetical protein